MVRKNKKHDETEEVLNKPIKLLEGKKSSLKQTNAANEKAEDEAGEIPDEIVEVTTRIGKALL